MFVIRTLVKCSGPMQCTGFYNLTGALGTIDKVLTLLPIVAVKNSFLSKSVWYVDDKGWHWISNMKITKYSIEIQPTNLQVTLRKSPCAPLPWPLPSPNSPISRGSSTIPPQLDGIPNVSASRVTLRLLTALDDSTHSQRPMWPSEQSVGVTLYCRSSPT